jgi:hypothetical protein
MASGARKRSKRSKAAGRRPAALRKAPTDAVTVTAVKTTQGRAATTVHVEIDPERLAGARREEVEGVVAQVPSADARDGRVRWCEEPLIPAGDGGARTLRYLGTRYEGSDAARLGIKVRVRTRGGTVSSGKLPVREADKPEGDG